MAFHLERKSVYITSVYMTIKYEAVELYTMKRVDIVVKSICADLE